MFIRRFPNLPDLGEPSLIGTATFILPILRTLAKLAILPIRTVGPSVLPTHTITLSMLEITFFLIAVNILKDTESAIREAESLFEHGIGNLGKLGINWGELWRLTSSRSACAQRWTGDKCLGSF